MRIEGYAFGNDLAMASSAERWLPKWMSPLTLTPQAPLMVSAAEACKAAVQSAYLARSLVSSRAMSWETGFFPFGAGG